MTQHATKADMALLLKHIIEMKEHQRASDLLLCHVLKPLFEQDPDLGERLIESLSPELNDPIAKNALRNLVHLAARHALSRQSR